ncbi:acyl-CoA dehydratase activase-related protein [Moorella sulfitireducens]|uniref:acyl-CoA dehydratase activase-related protein n=1 Tax=Neomoorella sulfitireducens TaxID=2972948 RepID=UPI0021AC1F73|nr:acyl-CoA dehydratase activase-related protein [Moorella sulfitireducens]
MASHIGFPTALFYYSHYPFWLAFFNRLGIEVVTSPKTTKAILDDGSREAVADACIPIKLYHGHVLTLKDKVDAIFIPRMVKINRRTTFCPKFLGLPDMVRASLPHLPPIIDLQVDASRGLLGFWPTCRGLADLLGRTRREAWSAYLEGRHHHHAYQKLLQAGYLPLQAMAKLRGETVDAPARTPGSLNLAVLGYPYQVYDQYISLDIIGKLKKLQVNIWTMEMINPARLYRLSGRLPKRLFWHYSNLVLGAAYYYLRQENIDGIIHVTAFGCGPDAMVDKIMELDIRKFSRGQIPFMSVSIDEQTGDAGITTRLEAFIDMLHQKRRGNR